MNVTLSQAEKVELNVQNKVNNLEISCKDKEEKKACKLNKYLKIYNLNMKKKNLDNSIKYLKI